MVTFTFKYMRDVITVNIILLRHNLGINNNIPIYILCIAIWRPQFFFGFRIILLYRFEKSCFEFLCNITTNCSYMTCAAVYILKFFVRSRFYNLCNELFMLILLPQFFIIVLHFNFIDLFYSRINQVSSLKCIL